MAEDTAQILTAITQLRVQVSAIARQEKVDLSPVIELLTQNFSNLQESINAVVAEQNHISTMVSDISTALATVSETQLTILERIGQINTSNSIQVEEFQE